MYEGFKGITIEWNATDLSPNLQQALTDSREKVNDAIKSLAEAILQEGIQYNHFNRVLTIPQLVAIGENERFLVASAMKVVSEEMNYSKNLTS